MLTKRSVLETLLDLLDLYTHYKSSTVVGHDHALEDFISIRIALNQEASTNRYSRYTQGPRKQLTNGVKAVNGISKHKGAKDSRSALSPLADQDKDPRAPSSVGLVNGLPSHGKHGVKDGTVRFMLDPERARSEKQAVADFFKVEEEEYEVEVEVERERRRVWESPCAAPVGESSKPEYAVACNHHSYATKVLSFPSHPSQRSSSAQWDWAGNGSLKDDRKRSAAPNSRETETESERESREEKANCQSPSEERVDENPQPPIKMGTTGTEENGGINFPWNMHARAHRKEGRISCPHGKNVRIIRTERMYNQDSELTQNPQKRIPEVERHPLYFYSSKMGWMVMVMGIGIELTIRYYSKSSEVRYCLFPPQK